MSEEIPERLALERFRFCNGRWECCFKELKRSARGRLGVGAWEAHHRFPNRPVTFENIRVVCSTGINCHLNYCHLGFYQNDPIWNPCRKYG